MTNEEVRALIERLPEYASWHVLREAADALTALLARAEAAESALATVRRDTLEEAAKVCENEKVDAMSTGAEPDYAYNVACDHCQLAIRALAEQPKE